ncbi:MAG: hypothetical protein IJ641_11305 [Lachnospiraceae bacterium]|nr:hypothetical protein [Lachnospiraceae bacterium]
MTTSAAASRKWREDHPGYDKAWREKHREEIRVKDRNYYHANRTKILAKLKEKRNGKRSRADE